jgi:RimJ/RimL family protein N-acetyltransferase
MQDLRTYAEKETLKDGTVVTVRAVRPDDGYKIRTAFKSLDRATLYSRFFGFKADVTEAELAHITGVDFERDVALLVTIGSGEDEMVIGGVSYFTVDSDVPGGSAELAFTVEEEYQGQGIASSLLRRLAEIARQKGVGQFEAEVLTSNCAMLNVFHHSGLPMTLRQDEDIVHVTLSLLPGGDKTPATPPEANL